MNDVLAYHRRVGSRPEETKGKGTKMRGRRRLSSLVLLFVRFESRARWEDEDCSYIELK